MQPAAGSRRLDLRIYRNGAKRINYILQFTVDNDEQLRFGESFMDQEWRFRMLAETRL